MISPMSQQQQTSGPDFLFFLPFFPMPNSLDIPAPIIHPPGTDLYSLLNQDRKQKMMMEEEESDDEEEDQYRKQKMMMMMEEEESDDEEEYQDWKQKNMISPMSQQQRTSGPDFLFLHHFFPMPNSLDIPAPILHPPGTDPYSLLNPNPPTDNGPALDVDPSAVSQAELISRTTDLTLSEHKHKKNVKKSEQVFGVGCEVSMEDERCKRNAKWKSDDEEEDQERKQKMMMEKEESDDEEEDQDRKQKMMMMMMEEEAFDGRA